QFPEGLLSRAGDRGARPVPRPGEAPHGEAARPRRREGGRGIQRRHGGGQRGRRGAGGDARMNYYVYYKVDAGRATTLRQPTGRMFAAIDQQTGVRGRWLRRRDDPSTYMEVYEGVTDTAAFEAVLARESAGLGLARKTELFQSA